MSSHQHKLLVVGPAWVGDMVMAQSLFMTLKKRHPDCRIDVLAPSWSMALLDRMPEIANAIAMPIGHGELHLFERWRLGRQLRAAGYRQAIVLPNSWKSAVIPWAAGIPLRTGYVGEARWGLLNDVRTLDKQQLPMTVQRFVALGLDRQAELPPTYAAPRLQVDPARCKAVGAKFSVDRGARILALCPGAEYGPAKRWPIDHYAELATTALQHGWQVWLFGSEKDREVAERINQSTQNRCRDFTGKTMLAEAVDLLALADAVVSNDSGLMHVAAALDKKLIALYGSSDPGFTPPLNPTADILCRHLPCAPCFKRQCPLGHLQCLESIRPDEVWQALQA